MPVLLIRDAREVESLERLQDEGHGLPLDCASCRKCGHKIGDFVAIHDDGVPTEGLSTSLVGVEVVLQTGGLALAQTIHVEDRHQVVKFVE